MSFASPSSWGDAKFLVVYFDPIHHCSPHVIILTMTQAFEQPTVGVRELESGAPMTAETLTPILATMEGLQQRPFAHLGIRLIS